MNGRAGYKPVTPKTSVLAAMLDEAEKKQLPVEPTIKKKLPPLKKRSTGKKTKTSESKRK